MGDTFGSEVGRAKMNWHRGLIRAWLLLSIIWCVAVAGYVYSEHRDLQPVVSQMPVPDECNDKTFISLACVD